MKGLLLSLLAAFLLAGPAMAAGPKDYQVTGPVLDVKDDVIVVQKGNEKWEIGREKNTKVSGDLKKGARVTVHYKMNASNIEVKDTGKAKTETKAKAEEKKVETKPK
jgi:hypothetical protein